MWGWISGSFNILVVNDISLYKDISTKDSHKFPIRAGFHTGDNVIKKTLFFMDADENWKRVRSIVSPAFTSGKLRAMCAPIENITDKFIDNLHPFSITGNEFDIRTLLDGFTMDVISRCAYGIELDSMSQPNHPGEFNSTLFQFLINYF